VHSVMPLVGAALLVHSLDVARSHASSLSRKMNHLEALDMTRGAVAGKTEGIGKASAFQGTAQTPRRLAQTSLTQTTIQMMNDVWNLNS